jgi:tetrahydromethanopterin S-methyltransferase subunit G
MLSCEWCRKRLQCYEQEQHQQLCTVAAEVIECELKPFGCPQKLPRMNMSQHMQDHCNEHVKLLKRAYKHSFSKVNLLEKDQVDMEKKYQTLTTRFDQLNTEVNNIRKEKAQSLRVQSLLYKCAIGLSIILGLLIGIFLQYVYPVHMIFVKLVLPAVVLSVSFLGICGCYVYLSSLFPVK